MFEKIISLFDAYGKSLLIEAGMFDEDDEPVENEVTESVQVTTSKEPN